MTLAALRKRPPPSFCLLHHRREGRTPFAQHFPCGIGPEAMAPHAMWATNLCKSPLLQRRPLVVRIPTLMDRDRIATPNWCRPPRRTDHYLPRLSAALALLPVAYVPALPPPPNSGQGVTQIAAV